MPARPQIRRRRLCLAGLGLLLGAPFASARSCPAYLDHAFRKLHSEQKINLCTAYAGKPLLIVNTASHCGYTPQFQALQALHEKYRGRGLVVIGFPSDDFNQESNDEAETATVCFINYGVTFTMLAPLVVTGKDANPVFRELARQTREPEWNFNKYLVRPDGRVLRFFGSTVTPDSALMTQAIEELLGGTASGS
jgi:glutathione peroxidase